MSGRYIDADALYEKTAEWEAQALHMVEIHSHNEDNAEWKRWSVILTERSAFKFDIADMPTADVVEVVRCKDCKHYSADGWGYGNCYRGSVEYLRMADNGFCSYGERREE